MYDVGLKNMSVKNSDLLDKKSNVSLQRKLSQKSMQWKEYLVAPVLLILTVLASWWLMQY